MNHFINKAMLAPNVMEVPVDPAIVAEFATRDGAAETDWQSVSPGWGSDIVWLSASTPSGHARFESAFERIGVAGHVRAYLDIDREVRLYAGFVIVRRRCAEPHFHVDWVKADNQAFTMLTPVSANAGELGLLYRKLTGEIGEYRYKPGKALIFGDHFSHSTQPGESKEPIALLCFEFGTDRMEHWERINATIGYQTRFLRRPDGAFVETALAGREGG